ncbi:Ubiquitin carboxyl-terminal hydrolase 27 [Olea europaea subsp. europaea]|uniref:Ubiquitin carboxyl-terminal hydrolase 27 n=1 Tax=Olea europaea subsp. europaea TaxID=158383 RepID=A0A8S0Q8Z1_OLEEU|nr:Ubiquitin carboxyl-terminal hydrolase 27 [Olea europaea subsp. europaea]
MKISSSIPKLNYVSKFLSEQKWNSASGRKISIAVGVLSAAGILLAVKDKVLNFNSLLLLSDGDSEKYGTIPGLQNLLECYFAVRWKANSKSYNFYLDIIFQIECFLCRKWVSNETKNLKYTLIIQYSCLSAIKVSRIIWGSTLVVQMRSSICAYGTGRFLDDAEEAFSHLLSSLREELPVVINNGQGEWQRWLHSFLGPFDGIVDNILICKAISLDFQLFHNLHLLPPINHGRMLAGGLPQAVFVAEHLGNYGCSHCWHNAAKKYVSTVAEDKTDIGKLQSCTHDDSCECKTPSSLQGFPGSNRFCRVFKQLSIAVLRAIFLYHYHWTCLHL